MRQASSLALFGLFYFAVAAAADNNSNEKESTTAARARRLRRSQQRQQQAIAINPPSSDKVSEQEQSDQERRRAQFGGTNLVAQWVKEAKQDLEEIQEMLTKALDDGNSMPTPPVPVPTRAPPKPQPKPTKIPTPSPTRAPVVEPTTSAPTSSAPTFENCGMSSTQRSEEITTKLSSVSKPEDLADDGSPQSMARDWLISKDGLVLCPDDSTLIQRYVAAVFYYSTLGDGWAQCSAPEDLDDEDSVRVANENCNVEVDAGVGGTEAWLTAVTECDWGGMACVKGEDSLERIDFESNNLQGTIPFELQELFQLRFLHLEEGRTAGSIPPEIGSLSDLEEFDVNFNLLVGPIPDTMYNLANLEEFDLNDNLLGGSISSNIGNLKKLRFFQISKNRITGTIPSEMGQLTELAIANFDRNQMTGEMPQEVCDLRNIEKGLIGSLTSDCLDPSAKFYVECKSPQCCTQCFEPSILITGDERGELLPDNRNP